MGPTQETGELSTYKLAAVLVVDLVKHSVRAKSDIRRIQKVIEEVFYNTLASMKIDSVLHNYTGDGYVWMRAMNM